MLELHEMNTDTYKTEQKLWHFALKAFIIGQIRQFGVNEKSHYFSQVD